MKVLPMIDLAFRPCRRVSPTVCNTTSSMLTTPRQPIRMSCLPNEGGCHCFCQETQFLMGRVALITVIIIV